MRHHGHRFQSHEQYIRRSVSETRLKPLGKMRPDADAQPLDPSVALGTVVSVAVLVGLTAICMIAARAGGLVDWPWWLVTSPLWLPGSLCGAALAIAWGGHALAAWIARAVSGR